MALLQGDPLPNITTSQTQTTQAPSWYTDYLTNLSNTGTSAGANAQYVGAQPLQNQAFNLAASNVGNYQPNLNAANFNLSQVENMSALGSANNMLNESANMSAAGAGQQGINAAMQTAPSNVQNYMNPYIGSVVDEAGRLGLQNIRNTISPQATAGAVGSGQFGSTRGANVLGQNITGALQNLGGQQQGLLASGYQNAITASQADMARQLQAGVAAGQLTATDAARLSDIGKTQGSLTSADMASKLRTAEQYGALGSMTQSLGMGDVNALSTMGAQQQQIGQNEQLFPLQLAEKQANIMRGFTIPTSVSGTYTGPIPGAYASAPLSQIMSGASLIGALSNTPIGQGIGNFFSSPSDPYAQAQQAVKQYGAGNVYGPYGGSGVVPSSFDPNQDSLGD